MKVLILYHNPNRHERKTISDHLFCFKRYIPDVEFHYCNVLWGIPFYLKRVQYDAVILHYTLLAVRWEVGYWKNHFSKALRKIKYLKGHKIAIPQDEYAHTDELNTLFKDVGVKTVFTCAQQSEYEKLYPQRKSGLEYYFTVYTGYIDEETLSVIEKLKAEKRQREVDIGYRARKLPYWLGYHGQLKSRIANEFLNKKSVDLTMDVSCADNKVFYGDDWFRFLLRCRTVLGCLGGASLLDNSGKIREKVDKYVFLNPQASFEEVKEKLFRELDGNLKLFALSPRHFECCMTESCQVLLEGDYDGVLEPDKHYIEIKKDFSNLDEVIEKIKDQELCSKIAARAYRDIVLSGKYTYKKFAEMVMKHIIFLPRERKIENIVSDKIAYSCLFFEIKIEYLRKLGFRKLHHMLFVIPRRVLKLISLIKNACPKIG